MGASRDLATPWFRWSFDRRRLLGDGGGAAAAAMLAGRGASRTAAQDADPVAPLAASGGLEEQTIRVLIFSGPEADAHTRLAPQFTEYTGGKVTVEITNGGRDVDYTTAFLAAMQAQSDAYDVLHSDANGFLRSGPAGFFAPLDPFMADANLFNAEAFNLADFPPSLLALFQVGGQQFLLPQEASTLMF